MAAGGMNKLIYPLILSIILNVVVITVAYTLSSQIAEEAERARQFERQAKGERERVTGQVEKLLEAIVVIDGSEKPQDDYSDYGKTFLTDAYNRTQTILQDQELAERLQKQNLSRQPYVHFRAGIADLLAELDVVAAAYKEVRSSLETERRSGQDAQAAHQQKVADQDQEIKLKTDELGEQTLARAGEKDKFARRERELLEQKKAIERDALERRREKERELTIARNEVLKLQSVIEELQKKRKIEREESAPDGEVIFADNRIGFAWVNLGRRHGVRRGQKFDVFQYVKGGRRKPKGQVEIKRTDEETSQVAILSTVDELDPLVSGDMITSPFFDKDETKIFVILGTLRNRLYNADDVRRMIDDVGGGVEDQVTVSTDYVILGQDAQNNPQFEQALQYGVQLMQEDELFRFIGH